MVFNQERFDELAKGLATNRLSRGQVLKALVASTSIAAMVPVLRGKPALAAKTCEVRTVTVWINAFIPRHISGYTKPHPNNPEKTVIRGPAKSSYCYNTDQRGFSSDIGASAKMHSEIKIDFRGGTIVSQHHVCSQTTAMDCKRGTVVCTKTGKVRADSGGGKPFFDFQASKGSSASVRLDAASYNPCVVLTPDSLSPDIDYEGTITLEEVGTASKKDVKVAFVGKVDDFPAFEMYASADGGAPQTLFRRFPGGKDVWNLPGDADSGVNYSVTLPATVCEDPCAPGVCSDCNTVESCNDPTCIQCCGQC